jgi:hypothetical protein
MMSVLRPLATQSLLLVNGSGGTALPLLVAGASALTGSVIG